jgi:hypothetical protein
MYPRVQGVITQQGTDISDLCNDVADRYGFPSRCLIALGIAESNLNELAWRDRGGNDRSAGIWQQTVRWAPIGDQTHSPENIAYVRERFTTDIPLAADVAARQFGHYYRLHGSYEEAASRYNGGPNMPWSQNPNQGNYLRAWRESATYVRDEDTSMSGWEPIDLRHDFPYLPGQSYDTRPLSAITGVVMHHGASAMPAPTQAAEVAMLHQYEAYHRANMGAPTIAYHLAIGGSGSAYYLNDLTLISWHAGPANAAHVGICLIGDFSAEPPSAVMIDAARRARGWVAQQCGRDDLPYSGHADWMGTQCPGGWWPEHRDWLAGLPDDAPAPEPEPGEPAPDPWAEVARLNAELADARSWAGALDAHVIKPGYALLDAALTTGDLDRAKKRGRDRVAQVRDLLAEHGGRPNE